MTLSYSALIVHLTLHCTAGLHAATMLTPSVRRTKPQQATLSRSGSAYWLGRRRCLLRIRHCPLTWLRPSAMPSTLATTSTGTAWPCSVCCPSRASTAYSTTNPSTLICKYALCCDRVCVCVCVRMFVCMDGVCVCMHIMYNVCCASSLWVLSCDCDCGQKEDSVWSCEWNLNDPVCYLLSLSLSSSRARYLCVCHFC